MFSSGQRHASSKSASVTSHRVTGVPPRCSNLARRLSKLCVSSLISVLLVAPSPGVIQEAVAATCQGKKTLDGTRYGSAIDGGSVTICAKSSTKSTSTSITTTTKTGTSTSTSTSKPKTASPSPSPSPTKKATASPSPSKSPSVCYDISKLNPSSPDYYQKLALACPLPKPKSPAVSKTAASTSSKQPAKNAVSTAPVSTTSKLVLNDRAVFSPRQPFISASPATVVQPLHGIYFFSDATTHYRMGSLLGRAVEVRFTPIAHSWAFGDGFGSAESTPSHRYLMAGMYWVVDTVTFAVAYRPLGTSTWISESEAINLQSNRVVVQVSVDGQSTQDLFPIGGDGEETKGQAGSGKIRLVREGCLEPWRFACG